MFAGYFKNLMKKTRQIALSLISLFPFLFMGNVLYAKDVAYQLEANSESLVIEEGREVSIEFQEIIEVSPEISGGYPDIVSNNPATAILKEEIAIVSTYGIKSKYIHGGCLHLGKLPLYLRYQALKLHC